MQTKLSTKGQIVLPGPLRRRLGLRAGDLLKADIRGDQIVLTPKTARKRKPRIVPDTVTGHPVLTFGPDAPVLTSAEVREILSNFP